VKFSNTRSKATTKIGASLRSRYLDLLDKNRSEQTYQRFIEQNTVFVPRNFVQNHGIHFNLLLRKLAFGNDYISDFFYLSKSSRDWYCVFVEIEKPSSRYFRDNSCEFHPDFNRALQQINSWRAWFSIVDNKRFFENQTVGFIRTPLTENPCQMKYILVHGRRSESEASAKRRGLINGCQRDDFKIMSFDSLAEDTPHKYPLYVASRHNGFIRILSDEICGENLFAWLPTDAIQMRSRLRTVLKAHKWAHRATGKKVPSKIAVFDSKKTAKKTRARIQKPTPPAMLRARAVRR
jgi:hypothetical protein